MSSGNEKPRITQSRASPSKQPSASGTSGKSVRHQNHGERFPKRGPMVQGSQGKKKTGDGEVHTSVTRLHKQQGGGRHTQSPSPKEGSDKGGSAYDSSVGQGGREEVTVIEHCGKKGAGRSYQKSKQFDQTSGSRYGYKTVSFDGRKDSHRGNKVNPSKATGAGKAQPKAVPQPCEDVQEDAPVYCPDEDKGTLDTVTSQSVDDAANDGATVAEGDCWTETPDSSPEQVSPGEVEIVASNVTLNGRGAEEDGMVEEEKEKEEDEGCLEEKMPGISYTREFLVSKKFLLESSELSNSIRAKLTDLGILKGCESALPNSNLRETDPRMSAKVALTPQRKSFGGGCSWRNKVGGSESHEDGTDGGQSSLVRREEAGLYAFDEEEEEDATKGPDGEYGFARVGYGKAGQYLGHAPHPLPAGVDKGSDRAARVPRKIDHVPLRDQARREDYGGGREEQRDYHRDKSFEAAEPEWMTFDLGSSDEKFEFGGCDEIERMRNEMKAKLDNHEGNGEALRASSSTEKSPAANEEPSATEEDMAPQFIESWEELDEDDVLEGDGAVGQSGGSGSAAVGIDGISGAVDERNGMGLTDDVLTQLLGFHLDDPEEDALQGSPQTVPDNAALPFTDYYKTFPKANPRGPPRGTTSTAVSGTAAPGGSNPTDLLKQMLNIQGSSLGGGQKPAYPDTVAGAPPQQYGHAHVPNEQGNPTTRMLMLDEIEDAVVRDHNSGQHITEEEVELMMAQLAAGAEGLPPPGGLPNRMPGMYPLRGVPLREPVMDGYNRPLSEAMMDGYHLPPQQPPSGMMGQSSAYYHPIQAQPSAMMVDPMKTGTAQLDHFARAHQQTDAERHRAMLVHAAQMQQQQQQQRMQQHGIPVHPHLRQPGSMGSPQLQPRHAQHHQGGGKANQIGFMPTSVMRKMASQTKPEVLPAMEGPNQMWQAASVANAAKLEQDLVHKAVKTHETMSELLTSANAMGFVTSNPQQQQLRNMEEEMEVLLAAAAAGNQQYADIMSVLSENSLHPHQGIPIEAHSAGLPPQLPGHHNHQQLRVSYQQGHTHQQLPRPASYMQYM